MTKSIYVAGPLFSVAERMFLEHLVDTLAKASGLDATNDFFLPHRDSDEVGNDATPQTIFELDMQHLDPATTVVGFLDGQDVDSGTCIELGYAYAKGKKIFGIITDFRASFDTDPGTERPNLMVWGVCEEGHTLFQALDSLATAFAEHVGGNNGHMSKPRKK